MPKVDNISALKLLTLGYSVIPSGGGELGKAPLVNWTEFQNRLPTDDELAEWESHYKPSLWGIVTGKLSGIVIVDIDKPGDYKIFEVQGLNPHIITPRGGCHYYFKHPGYHVKTVAGLMPGMDIRGDGGFVNVIGKRADGKYKVVVLPTPDTIYPWDKLPEPIRRAMNSTKPTLTIKAGTIIPEGQRNQHLTSLGGSMRRRGMPQSAIEAALLEVNSTQCQPSLSEAEVMDIARSISRYEPDLGDEELGAGYIIVDKKGNQILDLAKLASDLLFEYHFATFQDTEEIIVYQDGVYQSNGIRFIKSECQRRVGVTALLTEHRVNEVIGHIKRSTYVERRMFNADKYIINLTNGLLDVCTCELKPHTPRFLSTIRIPVSYNPNADCPAIKKFFTEVHHPEDIPIISELFGYCLIPDYTLQWAFLFIGDGSNGKSVELNLLKAFIGGANCSNIPWHALEQHRFASSGLEGKLANIFADLPSQSLSMTTKFKMLTGGDTLDAEKKFKDPFSFVNFARLVFSANRPPKVYGDDSFAFWRRWIILEFPNQFNDDQKDPDILAKLTTPSELSGLLNLALNGLDRLLRNKIFSYHRSVNETTEYYLRAADPVYAFLQDCCEPSSEDWISKDKLYEIFGFYCKAMSIPLTKPNAFARSLQNQTAIHVSSTRPQAEGKRITAWQGIKLSEDVKDVKDVNDFPLFKSHTRNPHISKSKRKNTDNLDDPDGNDDIADYPAQPCPKCDKDGWAVASDGRHYYCSSCGYWLPNPGENFKTAGSNG